MKLPVQGTITSKFGMRKHPLTGINQMHNGVDISAIRGTSVITLLGGKVIASSFDNSRGNYVGIQKGTTEEWFYHLNTKTVKVGQVLTAGNMIGTVGNTGYSTGYHLHWGIKNLGQWIDPLTFKFDDSIANDNEITIDNTPIFDMLKKGILNFGLYIVIIVLFFYSILKIYKMEGVLKYVK